MIVLFIGMIKYFIKDFIRAYEQDYQSHDKKDKFHNKNETESDQKSMEVQINIMQEDQENRDESQRYLNQNRNESYQDQNMPEAQQNIVRNEKDNDKEDTNHIEFHR